VNRKYLTAGKTGSHSVVHLLFALTHNISGERKQMLIVKKLFDSLERQANFPVVQRLARAVLVRKTLVRLQSGKHIRWCWEITRKGVRLKRGTYSQIRLSPVSGYP
jgi:hypothetical protein